MWLHGSALRRRRDPSKPRPSVPAVHHDDPSTAWGTILVSADRLVPLVSYTALTQEARTTPTGSTPRLDSEQIEVGTTALFSRTWAQLPRLAVDGFLGEYVTFGGTVGAQVLPSEKRQLAAAGAKTSTIETDGFLISLAPRVGVVLLRTSRVGVWLRGGVTLNHFTLSTERNEGTTRTKSEVTGIELLGVLECSFVWFPVQHFAVTVGPVFDLPLARGSDLDRLPRVTHVGIAAGALVSF